MQVALPAEGHFLGREVNSREVGKKPWPGLSSGAVSHRRPRQRGAGGWGGLSQSREWPTRRVSWPLKIFPRAQGVPVPEEAECSYSGRGRAASVDLGLIGQLTAYLRGTTKLPSSPPRRPQPSFAASLGLQGSFLSLFFRHCFCLLSGVALVSEIVLECRAFTIPVRGSLHLHQDLKLGLY